MNVLGIGIDLVDIARIEKMMKSKGQRVLKKLLTEREQAYVATLHAPARAVAARIAAKEASYKALQSLPDARAVGWHDLEVLRHADGRPVLRLHNLAAQLAETYGPLEIHLSLTHSDATAGAVALLTKKD
ncbi:MAG: holo-ACP synthase [Gemmatimonadota bacterium]